MGILRQILPATTKEQKAKNQHKVKCILKPATSFTFLTWFWRKKTNKRTNKIQNHLKTKKELRVIKMNCSETFYFFWFYNSLLQNFLWHSSDTAFDALYDPVMLNFYLSFFLSNLSLIPTAINSHSDLQFPSGIIYSAIIYSFLYIHI